MNHQKIERQADEAYAEFMRQWSRAIRADAGEPTHVEVWHHAWRAALAAAPVQPAIPPDSRELELAAPAQDARKPLTDAQVQKIVIAVCDSIYPQGNASYSEADSVFYGAFASAIESEHGIK